MTDPIAAIATFAGALDTLPDCVQRTAELAIIDYLGVAAIGALERDIVPLRQYVASTYSAGAATALGIPSRLAAPGAAYVNGTVGHVLDYDDFHDTAGGHPTVVIMPALLALAEERNAPAAEVVSAYVVGVEVMCALGRALNHTHYERGWHPTATLGILATTAACARLSHLDHEQTARALGIAASFGSGLKGSSGTSMKSTQVGRPEAMSADAIASASCDRARSTARRAGRSEAERTHWVASDPREPADGVEQCGAHVGNVRGVLQTSPVGWSERPECVPIRRGQMKRSSFRRGVLRYLFGFSAAGSRVQQIHSGGGDGGTAKRNGRRGPALSGEPALVRQCVVVHRYFRPPAGPLGARRGQRDGRRSHRTRTLGVRAPAAQARSVGPGLPPGRHRAAGDDE
jgi:hypothetical protein